MVSERKFYKTVHTIVVLSETPTPEGVTRSLEDLHYMTTDGGSVGKITNVVETVMNGKEAADELYEQFSEPGFFMLDDKGDDIEDFGYGFGYGDNNGIND